MKYILYKFYDSTYNMVSRTISTDVWTHAGDSTYPDGVQFQYDQQISQGTPANYLLLATDADPAPTVTPDPRANPPVINPPPPV